MSNRSNDIPEGFRMTELGRLPEGWEVVKFDAVVLDILTGDWGETNPGPDLQQCYVLRGTDFYQALKGSFTNTPIRYLKTSSIQKRQLRDGDILIELSGGSKDQPTGRIMMVNHEMQSRSSLPLVFSNFVKRLNVKTDSRPEFFWRYWEHLYRNGVTRIYEKRTTGIRNFKLNDFLASEHIPLPLLAEQKAIAGVLSTIQRASEAQDKIIAAVREMKKSLMRHLFTYGPVPVAEAEQVPLKQTEIGPVPEQWETTELGGLFEIKQGKALSPAHRRGIGPRLFLRTANVFWGYLNLTSIDSMDFTDKEVSQLNLIPNDLLVCEGGDIGRTAIWRGELDVCCYQNHLHRLRTSRDDVHPLFYMYWMQTAYLLLGLYGGTGNKTTIPNLSQSRLKSLVLPLPPISEQQEIAHMLSRVDTKIEAEEKRKASLQTLFKTMLRHLMTGKVRVKDLEVAA